MTRMQEMSMDYHFKVEQESGSSVCSFFCFNGTAGVWRISAVCDAGGWNERATVEDMDLAVRASLRGWKFIYKGNFKTLKEFLVVAEAEVRSLTSFYSNVVILIGICLPMYAIHSSNKPWDSWDFIATVVCITGNVIAYFADTQLHNFVQRNETLREQGISLVPNLEEGLWGYSRHPTYIWEQLWWWGLFIFGWNVGQGWMLVGPLTNSLCLAYVTVLFEQRMLKKEYRAEAYRQYQKTTSVWIPCFCSAIKGPKETNI